MNGRELLAWNLRRLRVEKGLSQERLAADTSIDRAYLGGLERKTENASVDLLDRLARGLSAGIWELFVVPEPGAEPPKPLRGGRRAK
ncbi:MULTISPECIES: helix-turn-helix domain-containing protein [unclassified Aureimonas]|uniref:helix-turn-helix domain-containing protein n=1 Tax=unclassified Aureimonas TaxID=2615206 RepID=UPI0009EC7159|nr:MULTISPECIES: helix-turn-helix transcriptional regulator [unclassified Aureimonas]